MEGERDRGKERGRDGWMEGGMVGWRDECMDGWMDGGHIDNAIVQIPTQKLNTPTGLEEILYIY